MPVTYFVKENIMEIKQTDFICSRCGGKVLFDGENYFCESDGCGMVIPASVKKYADCSPGLEDGCIERFFSCGNSFEFFATIDGEFQSFSYNFNEERNIVEKRTIIGSEAKYEDVRKPVL
jgi:hypothetical protein